MATPTIYDVAGRAKVSIATVSRVINTPHRVNVETRNRVLEAIEKLKFVPKAEATARARRSNHRIGVLAPFFTYPSFVQRLRGVASVLNGSKYELVVYNVDTLHHYQVQMETLPLARRIDGLIIMSLMVDDRCAERLMQHQLPTVLIESTHAAFGGIETDNHEGGRLAAQYLIDAGHREIAFIGINSEIPGCTLPTSAMRLEGFREAMAESSLDLHDTYIRQAENHMEAAYIQAQSLLALEKRPTAIFATSDLLALGVLKAIREAGLQNPNDVAVMGFDDLDIADYVGLTTISQSLDESGRVGTEMLLGRLTEPMRPIQHVRFPLEVIERSTA